MAAALLDQLDQHAAHGLGVDEGDHGAAGDGREEAYRQRFRDPRSRAYRTADGDGAFLLFGSGTTTQLCHLAVRRAAQGRGLGRRMLELARGLVPAGRPLWLFTQAGGAGDRTAAAAGWTEAYRAGHWLLDLRPAPDRPAPAGAQATKGNP